MCWLLIRARSNTKNATSWKAGDVVEVRPDDFAGWGTAEGLPSFYRVQIRGVDASLVKELLEMADRTENGVDDNGRPRFIYNRVRKHRIHIATIPASIKSQLLLTGIVSVTKAQIRNYIKDNQDNMVSIDG